jgi:hypothetical protein
MFSGNAFDDSFYFGDVSGNSSVIPFLLRF